MPHTIIARLYEHIEPLNRGKRYEDPLDSALRGALLGQVTGGGSQVGASGEIEYVDIEIRVDNLDDALAAIVETLQRSGAPVGSELIGPNGVLRQFGAQQSVAVYLDGVTLAAQVYRAFDPQDLVDRLRAAVGPKSFHGYWQGSVEIALYFFGEDAEEIFRRLEPILTNEPIGQNARLVVRPAKDPSRHRTTRLPRQ